MLGGHDFASAKDRKDRALLPLSRAHFPPTFRGANARIIEGHQRGKIKALDHRTESAAFWGRS